MADRFPKPLTASQQKDRFLRVTRIARRLGFVGTIEYRHVYSSAGGAQYGRGRSEKKDLLIVYAEAFERDADASDFNLEAILAHECGHQILARHPRIAKRVAGRISDAGEEVLPSILGSLISVEVVDRDNLRVKAVADFVDRGESVEAALERFHDLATLFGALL